MKKDYVPDGWLDFISSTRMYIDFDTYEFDKAVQLLDNKIRLQKRNNYFSSTYKKIEIDNQKKENVNEEVEDYHHEIEETINFDSIFNWDENVVRNFLIKKNLSNLLPLCNGINGDELNYLYGMCRSNSMLMYHSLKFELLKLHDKLLPISTYLHFLSCLDAVGAYHLPLNLCIDREYLEEHVQDDK
ncbi:unnamed protein product [Rotaria sp. Silwood2]|nr:unnamed protein product [Rotaria sp. Silwood2]